MFNVDYLKQLLIISIALSTITCAFIQKTKILFKSSKYIEYYSFLVNMLVSVIFCITFTDIKFPNSLWIGLFSFLGADSLYKSLEGKISSHKDIINKKTWKNTGQFFRLFFRASDFGVGKSGRFCYPWWNEQCIGGTSVWCAHGCYSIYGRPANQCPPGGRIRLRQEVRV